LTGSGRALLFRVHHSYVKRREPLTPVSPPLALRFSRVKLFLALSRTPHGLLDLAAPALAAILCAGGVQPPGIIALGLLTVFAGYTAVYALNDVVDYRVDVEKLRAAGPAQKAGYLDAIFMRHPLAQGQVSFREGVLWTAGWAAVALTGAYMLNPVCAYLFLAGCLLEFIYCRLLRVSHLRVLVSGVVKTLGGVAAAFAVSPHPSRGFVLLLFLWLFCWEIGGQNIPADWHDLEEDQRLRARTMPVRYGPGGAGAIILGALALSVALSIPLLLVAPLRFSPARVGLALAAGGYLLLLPGYRLFRTKDPARAAALFNHASAYPLAVLGLAAAGLVH
jgi:4-hydroxybenzoate polyprenyltransferase